MDPSHGAWQRTAPPASSVQIAKAALRRLALDKVEPTPHNYARAYAAEGGVLSGRPDDAARANDRSGAEGTAEAQRWADLLQRLAQGLDRGSRAWTASRRKDGLRRLLLGSGGDSRRLQQRLGQLLAAWEGDVAGPGIDAGDAVATVGAATAGGAAGACAGVVADDRAHGAGMPQPWLDLLLELQSALQAALPAGEPQATELAAELAQLAHELADSGVTEQRVLQARAWSERARRVLTQRDRLFAELGRLCGELTGGLVDLAEDDSWARGQCEMMRTRLAEGLSLRNVRAAGELLADARRRQGELRGERAQARDALKQMIQGMLDELGEFGEHTGRFHDRVGRHAEAIARADSLDGLAGVVREMVEESRAVQAMVGQTQARLQDEQARAEAMQARVQDLENELRRLSDEVGTDALTQVANRRGLTRAFDAEVARLRRAAADGRPGGLAVGLIDIDNFKKLNDTLGHAAGDVALRSLAQRVSEQLRPQDTVARFGGEEFVLLLPDTALDEAQQVMSRLQRRLTASLFMHENREVFVTFSGGVTVLRDGEALEAALERADEALYEAKRTGKNRTCAG